MNQHIKYFLQKDREKALKAKSSKPVINTERVKAISNEIAEYFKNSGNYEPKLNLKPKPYTFRRIQTRFQKEVSLEMIHEIKQLPKERININYISTMFDVSVKTVYGWKKFGFSIINSEVDKDIFIKAVLNSPEKFIILGSK